MITEDTKGVTNREKKCSDSSSGAPIDFARPGLAIWPFNVGQMIIHETVYIENDKTVNVCSLLRLFYAIFKAGSRACFVRICPFSMTWLAPHVKQF
jgi:hypothetical protein